jgi:hypothetical protein
MVCELNSQNSGRLQYVDRPFPALQNMSMMKNFIRSTLVVALSGLVIAVSPFWGSLGIPAGALGAALGSDDVPSADGAVCGVVDNVGFYILYPCTVRAGSYETPVAPTANEIDSTGP